jgi:hypothetical protein
VSNKLIKYGYRTEKGPTIRELIWQQLDDAMDKLMEGKPEKAPADLPVVDPEVAEFVESAVGKWQAYGREQGIAEATAYIIALFEQPEHPDIISVKGAAVLRYKEKQHLLELRSMEDTSNAETDGELNSELGVVGEPSVAAGDGNFDDGQASER